MADIFISYANEDRETAGHLARALESAGMSVWWDRRIPAGRTWRAVLEEALQGMRCLIVLWSQNSLKSPWVLEEAEEARRLEKLLFPVLIETVAPPVGFRAIQAANLIDWDGSADAPAVPLLIADLKALLGDAKRPTSKPQVADDISRPPASEEIPWEFPLRRLCAGHWKKLVGGGAALAGVLVALQISMPGRIARETQSVAPVHEPAPSQPPARRLTAIIIDGTRRQLKPADSLALTLQGQYSDGTKSDVAGPVDWISSDADVAVVDTQGKVKALQPGMAEISARQGELVSASWTVTVKSDEKIVREIPAVRMVKLEIMPARKELLANDKVALRVHGRYSDQSEKPITRDLRWQISDPTIAAITPEGQLSGLRPGRVDVAVRAGDVTSAPVTLVVKELPKKAQVEIPLWKTPIETKAVVAPAPVEAVKARLGPYIARAKSLREQGQYAAALAELQKAAAVDPSNAELVTEIEKTKRACAAERSLGQRIDC
ncbi:MAG: TIR domain-containing protein [Candidatus Binatia bacterium]